MAVEEYATLEFDVRDSVTHVTLNRPEVGNALNLELAQELLNAVLRCDEDPEVRKAGLKNASEVSPHWLRHAHASHAMDRGAEIHLVQATLGHSDISTTGTSTSTPGPTSPPRSTCVPEDRLVSNVAPPPPNARIGRTKSK